jgi:hypothetical protein
MARSLSINGSNFLPQYKTNSARIRKLIQNKSDVMNMQITVKSGQSRPTEGAVCIFSDGARKLFYGYVSNVNPTNEIGEGQLITYNVEVSDLGSIFDSKIVRRAYTNATLFAIVDDIITSYVEGGYGIDTTNVATGPTIASVVFDHISIRKCFEKLNKLTGYIWWVDYDSNLYFQETDVTPAPESITDTSNNFFEVSVSYDTSQVRNSVIVIGSPDGQESLSTNTQTFTGDGQTRSWSLEDKPSTVVSVKVNGVSKQYSLDVNERDTDDFVYSFSGQSITQTVAGTTLTGSDTLEIVYYPRIDIVAQKVDQDSINYFAVLDGGDGTREYTIKDSSITSKSEALVRAQQELDEFSMPLVEGVFKTRTGLLTAGSYFAPGQLLTVNLPSYGISTDTTFLIQEVLVEMNETASTVEYVYTVRFGGRLAGVREFLESLASTSVETTDPSKIITIESVQDLVVMEEHASSPSKINQTPPFDYGPAGNPQGRWNLSEWA